MKYPKSTRLGVWLLCMLFYAHSLSAELIIVSVDGKGRVQPLAMAGLSNSMKKDLFGIMMKYQWPSCTAYAFSEEILADQCSQIFSSMSAIGQGYLRSIVGNVRLTIQKLMNSWAVSEEEFIRSEIQKKYGKSLDVVSVASTFYELFTLTYLFQGASPTFMQNVQSVDVINVDDIVMAQTGVQGSRIKDVFKGYKKAFELSLLHDVETFNGSLDASVPLIEIYFEINEQFVKYMYDRVHAHPKKFAYHLARHKLSVGACLVKDLVASYPGASFMQTHDRKSNAGMFDFSYTLLCNELANNASTLNASKPLARMLTYEYEAIKKNRGLLLRGTSILESLSVCGKSYPYLLDTTLCTDSRSGCIDAEALKNLVPRSVCYGNSLFAGGLNDLGATVYCYLAMSDRSGYLLDVDKQAYFNNQCDNLFFISPFSTLLSLFACGQFFHSRTKAVVKNIDELLLIDGAQHGTYRDYTGLWLVKESGIEFEKRFANYLAEHARVIKVEDYLKARVSEGVLRKAHRQLANALNKV